MLARSDVIAFLSTADISRARTFFGDTLDLPLLSESPYALAFDANGTMLRVTPVGEVATPGYTVLGWRVADIGATVRGLSERGVEFIRYDGMDQDAAGIWTTPGGDRVAWFKDPDGNTLSVTQFPGG
jgi:catechol 2,3-dioxygenase-like lactoylglutathione lyase family enzyme